MSERLHLSHGFGPLVNPDSEVLILGSFPSVLSRQKGFFYGNPRNRFWSVLATIFDESLPITVEDKRVFCLRHMIALYDAIEECDIVGSKDDSIENVIPADIPAILSKSKVKTIICNGSAAKKYFLAYWNENPCISLFFLPSTSPANAAWSLSRLIQEWRKAFI